MKTRILISCLALLALAGSAPAASWNSAVSGDWNDSTKWSGGTLPTNGQDGTLTVNGSYTATINNATVDLSPTTVTNLNDIGIGNGAGDNMTLVINFTNTARNVSVRLLNLSSAGGATPTLQIDQGTIQARNRLNLGGGGLSGLATLRVVGGSLVATNSGGGDLNNIGGETAGTGFLDQQGGQVSFNYLSVGKVATSVGRWTLSGGTGSVSTEFRVGNVAGATGIVVLAGGTLSPTVGMWLGNDGVGMLISSNGTLNANGGIIMGYSGTGKGEWIIAGGTNNLPGGLGMNRIGGATSRLLMTGGDLNILNSNFNLGQQGHSGAIATISNGTMNLKNLSVGGSVDNTTGGSGQLEVFGGLVSVTNAMYVGARSGGGNISTGRVTVADSGILDVRGTLGLGKSGTSDRGYLTNQNGGTIRFTGVNNPNITVNSGSALVTTNATIEFMNAGAANLMGSVSNLISYQGDNTLRLNAATNATLSSYTFQANNGQRFAFLDLANGGAVLATNVTFGSGGKLTGTGSILARTVTNAGTIAPGASPGALAFTNDLTLASSSVLTMEIAGTNASLFDRIAVGGAFALDGTLNLSLINGFTPQVGNAFKIFDFASLTGVFAVTNLASPGAGLEWDTSNLYVTGTLGVLSVVPEPSTLAFLALGGLACLFRRRKA